MRRYSVEEMNAITFKQIEAEMLDLGNEIKRTEKEISEFNPENLRYSAVGYSRRITFLREITNALTELYHKTNDNVKNIINLLYMESETMEFVCLTQGISMRKLNALHKLIVNAVIEKLGMFRGNYTDVKETKRYLPVKVKREVLERDEGKCVVCGSDENLHFHHINRFSKGGRNHVDNLTLLCAHCHAEEHKDEKAYNLLKVVAGE